ncbi:hypothetical protein CV093_17845 [Oceanobacillus sp. 143]|nr:hypothetical protein CV093_17845 [Oceanobacillus sp. 143]
MITEDYATSTYTNALYTKEEMEKNNLKSAIVVSSDFHMRRSKLVFKDYIRTQELNLLILLHHI